MELTEGKKQIWLREHVQRGERRARGTSMFEGKVFWVRDVNQGAGLPGRRLACPTRK